MTYRLSPPVLQFIDQNGDPLAGGLLYFYNTGTSTPVNTYQDPALSIPNANPIVLDASGYAPTIFLTPGQSYKVILTDSTGVQQWAQDPVSDPTVGGGLFTSSISVSDGPGATKQLQLQTSGSNRFTAGTDASAESGGNVGSNFTLISYDDSGNPLHVIFNVNRSTGVLDFQVRPTVNGTDFIPAGVVQMYAGMNLPSGWLECNGAAVSRTTYVNLFNAVGTTYGVGDGSTTFNVPDCRGYFPRGFDHGAGVDPARALGSIQQDQVQDHAHNVTVVNLASGPSSGENAPVTFSGGTTIATSNPTTGNHGTETRPKNVAFYFMVKT